AKPVLTEDDFSALDSPGVTSLRSRAPNETNTSRPLRQITRALDILDRLAQCGGTSLADLSVGLELPRASVHRMLRTLEQRGYVHHATSEKVYRLGPAINALAAQSTES